jgi:hypothetical protein
MKTFLLLALFMALPFSDAMAQGKACTEMACSNGAILRPQEGMFDKPGKYEFQFFANGHNVKCEGRLPLKPCEEGDSFKCSMKAVRINENGCALPKDQHSIGDIYLFGTPKKVVMIAKRNGDTVLVRTLRPTYVFTRPNGPGCDPQCVTSTIPLGLKSGKD